MATKRLGTKQTTFRIEIIAEGIGEFPFDMRSYGARGWCDAQRAPRDGLADGRRSDCRSLAPKAPLRETERSGKQRIHRDDVRYREGVCTLARYGGEDAWGVFIGAGDPGSAGAPQIAGPFKTLRDARMWCRADVKAIDPYAFLDRWATEDTHAAMFNDLIALGVFGKVWSIYEP